jgi:hydroxyethylthiazole kinase-like uncharacterized protein yjeF
MIKNTPDLWGGSFPKASKQDHKYRRGQVAVFGGKDMVGAACMSADAAARVGTGLVTILSLNNSILDKLLNNDPLPIYKAFRSYILARSAVDFCSFINKAKSKGLVSCVLGPGLGNQYYKDVRSVAFKLLENNNPIVIDADGLNAFQGHHQDFFNACHKNVVLTPHEGEFKKLFPFLEDIIEIDRIKAASEAARVSGAVVVLKGFETIIAGNGEIVVNNNASPYLATAGSGDVLCGIISGFTAQGMSPFYAACAGVWMHGRTSQLLGAGLVAEDLIENIPQVLKEILNISN